MSMRRDAVVLAHEHLAEIISRKRFLDTLRMICGRWNVTPNSINTIASETRFTIDARSASEETLDRFESAIETAHLEV